MGYGRTSGGTRKLPTMLPLASPARLRTTQARALVLAFLVEPSLRPLGPTTMSRLQQLQSISILKYQYAIAIS